MDKFIITGGKKLNGSLTVDSAKNAVLAELAACILTKGEVIIDKCPDISDVKSMLQILGELGCRYTFVGDTLILDCKDADSYETSSSATKETRASFFLLGAILSRTRKAVVAYPGGCEIGNRPVDLHLKGLRALGVKIVEQNGLIICDGSKMRGGDVYLDIASVGATENIMMAATLISGTTRISNAAKEPEIADLARFINSMGGKIRGAGSSHIEIEGVKSLGSTQFTPIPDRIIAGTYLIATCMTSGEITLENANPTHLNALISKLEDAGAKIFTEKNKISLIIKNRPIAPQIVETLTFPGFPTDLQAQMTALAAIADGGTVVIENIFEGRYKFVAELVKMGANIMVRDRMAFITGVTRLQSADVSAGDLRGGAALVLAALAAEGTSTVSNIHLIDRGYRKLEQSLASLGADIKRT